MASHRSSDEVEQQHLDAFGPEAGALFHGLYYEVTWLHAKWLEYRKLFAKSEERIELLNETAGFFFKIVQDTLWENVILQIARLTDPPVQQGFANLTLRRIPKAATSELLQKELRALEKIVLERSVFARQWRNKRLAHTDLDLAISGKAVPLPGISRQQVEEALDSFRTIMNHWYGSVIDSEIAYDHFIAHDDADSLVYHLAVGARFDKRQRQRLAEGRHSPEDFEPPPSI